MIAGEVRRYRKARRMSVRQLSEEAGRLGLPIPQPVLSNFELGRRETISVAEWLLLAAVLRVPPDLLLFPVGRVDLPYDPAAPGQGVDVVEPIPGVEVSPLVALHWTETGRLGAAHADVVEPAPDALARLTERYHRHGELVGKLTGTEGTAEAIRRFSKDPEGELVDLKHDQQLDLGTLWDLRDRLRSEGFTPPELPESLRYVDEDPGL